MGIEAYIYYDVEDKAFERAAKTCSGGDNPNVLQMFLPVKTKATFFAAWTNIFQQAAHDNNQVERVCLFTHSSKEEDGGDGLEFASDDGDSGTLTREEMSELEKFPWSSHDKIRLELFGCNSGLRGIRKWCPAEHLAQTQAVPCRGETGFSYFSKVLDQYETTGPGDQIIFLHAYKRRKNAALLMGDGMRMPTRAFSPYIQKSVGIGCPNVGADVTAVQQFLNEVPAGKGGPETLLVEDGLIGPKTINAIKKFQNAQFGFQDGIVDPGKSTLIKLLEFKSF